MNKVTLLKYLQAVAVGALIAGAEFIQSAMAGGAVSLSKTFWIGLGTAVLTRVVGLVVGMIQVTPAPPAPPTT